jgi:hypothetical protein
VYRDNFDFQFANQTLDRQGHILELDPSAISHTSGIEVAGMLGFDMLHSLTMHLDYRDGLVKFESADSSLPSHSGSVTASAAHQSAAHESNDAECAASDTRDLPLNSALQAKVNGLLDSAHLKAGKQVIVTLVNSWEDSECTLSAGSILYGHVTSISSKGSGTSEFSLMFDHGDCDGHEKKAISLRIIGVVAPPDAFVGLHSVMPSQVAGRGRDISVTAQNMGSFALDENLNPSGPPHTIHPGIVAGYPKLKLEPLGGPGCSARFTSIEPSVSLGTGAQLLLTRQDSHAHGN